MRKIRFIVLIYLTLNVLGCATKQNKMETNKLPKIELYELNENGEKVAIPNQRISHSEFQQLVDENGGLYWKSTRIIDKNGIISDTDYYKMIRGRAPMNYYFKDGLCHTLFINNATGKPFSSAYKFSYDEKTQMLHIQTISEMKVVMFNKKAVGVLHSLGRDENNAPIYAYTLYERLSEEGVLQMKEYYGVNNGDDMKRY